MICDDVSGEMKESEFASYRDINKLYHFDAALAANSLTEAATKLYGMSRWSNEVNDIQSAMQKVSRDFSTCMSHMFKEVAKEEGIDGVDSEGIAKIWERMYRVTWLAIEEQVDLGKYIPDANTLVLRGQYTVKAAETKYETTLNHHHHNMVLLDLFRRYGGAEGLRNGIAQQYRLESLRECGFFIEDEKSLLDLLKLPSDQFKIRLLNMVALAAYHTLFEINQLDSGKGNEAVDEIGKITEDKLDKIRPWAEVLWALKAMKENLESNQNNEVR